MQHIQGISRDQRQVAPLEDAISQDNAFQFINVFVHSIHLERVVRMLSILAETKILFPVKAKLWVRHFMPKSDRKHKKTKLKPIPKRKRLSCLL
jgi:hypothetical protein